MPTPSGRVNRGPAAAAENRRALLSAARRLFAEHGYDVALSVIAREAGVGQGVLYRHFPTRFDLALTVFEEHLDELADLAARTGPGTFAALWERLVELTVDERGFVEMMVDGRRHAPEYDGGDRLRAALASVLDATPPGAYGAGLGVEEVLLVWRMVYGVVSTADGPDGLHAAVARALAMTPLPLTGGPGPAGSRAAGQPAAR